MIKAIVTSNKYSQEGLDVSINNDKLVVTEGKLIYDKEYRLDSDISVTIDDKTDTILLIEDIETKEILVAMSDGSFDKTKYRLIERLAWKNEGKWQKLSIQTINPNNLSKGEYNYEGLNAKNIKKSLTIHPGGQTKSN